MSLFQTITTAAAVAGSQRKLAALLNEPEAHISSMKSGRRSCTPRMRAVIATIAGENAAVAALEGILETFDEKDALQNQAKHAILASMKTL